MEQTYTLKECTKLAAFIAAAVSEVFMGIPIKQVVEDAVETAQEENLPEELKKIIVSSIVSTALLSLK